MSPSTSTLWLAIICWLISVGISIRIGRIHANYDIPLGAWTREVLALSFANVIAMAVSAGTFAFLLEGRYLVHANSFEPILWLEVVFSILVFVLGDWTFGLWDRCSRRPRVIEVGHVRRK